MHKKNAIISFLLFLVTMPLFFAVYTMIEKIIIEQQMEEKMEQENLQTLTLDAAAVIWLKSDKEILINGEPFDIKKFSRNGNKITVTGLFDTEEKQLKKKLQAYNNNDHNAAATNHSLVLLFFIACQHPTEINFHTAFFITTKQSWKNYQDSICNLSRGITAPPPRLL